MLDDQNIVRSFGGSRELGLTESVTDCNLQTVGYSGKIPLEIEINNNSVHKNLIKSAMNYG